MYANRVIAWLWIKIPIYLKNSFLILDLNKFLVKVFEGQQTQNTQTCTAKKKTHSELEQEEKQQKRETNPQIFLIMELPTNYKTTLLSCLKKFEK